MKIKTNLSLINISNTAVDQANKIIIKKKDNLKLRIYVLSGGCNGLKYGFSLKKIIYKDDYCIKKKNVFFIIDSVSLKYLIGSNVDYVDDLTGSYYTIVNLKNKMMCSCGLSFNI